ncbi:hypothetical protein LYNGBM3L_55750 [Moorena producens 3L]|uniref:Uncharacterized protein n=1 Tax=Moorena producens 3L TaxID=489825 RepID=F4XR26_9CYAN|nr:hypothetical protein LYNGBM3L_55750 [Moorena producens 3L]OLT64547.1 hypothetical protein BI334_05475 [Moorena producens 3L]
MILNFAPLAPLASNPSLGGNKNPFAGKSPPSEQSLAWGTNGGFDVANDTSQTTSNFIEIVYEQLQYYFIGNSI